MNTIKESFTPDTLLDFMRKHKENMPNAHSIKYKDKEYCPATYDETIDLLTFGDAANSTIIDMKVDALSGNSDGKRTTLQNSYTGSKLNIGRYVNGYPQCMMKVKKKEIERGELNILVDITCNASISTESIQNRGAAILSAIDKLRDKYFIKLTVISFIQNSTFFQFPKPYTHSDTRVTIDTKNSYSRSLCAFFLVNPAFLRRCILAKIEDICNDDNPAGYGKKADSKPEYDAGNTVYFPGITDNAPYCTITAAQEYVQKLIDNATTKRGR